MYYIDYLNKDKNFHETRKEFKEYEDAVEWGRGNLSNFNPDMVKVDFQKADFNYRHERIAITKSDFEKNVPENWRDNVNDFGVFSWGYYRAIAK